MFKNVRTFADLIKYKLSLAVVLSSVTGYFLAHSPADIRLMFLTAGIFLLSSGSAALNQVTERETDAKMERTKFRPIPSGRITPGAAAIISFILILTGSLFLLHNGSTALFLGLGCVVLYNFIYTGLKKTTVLSIIPGALVGAIPPMIGFTSAGGSLLHPYNIAFSLIMFLWQLPHFWLLIIRHGDDYRLAGFATISSWLSNRQIRFLVFFWFIITSALITLFFAYTNAFERNIIIVGFVLNAIVIVNFYRLLFLGKKREEIKKAFIFINIFGVLVMLALIAISLFRTIIR